MCSSSSARATLCSAREAAETWVRMSMQYLSSSTMRAMPRTWPSMRRSRMGRARVCWSVVILIASGFSVGTSVVPVPTGCVG